MTTYPNALLGLAASQTVGPFFRIGFEALYQNDLTVPGLKGRLVTIRGQVFDGDRLPVPDAVIEIWQANSFGKYAHPEDQQDKLLDLGGARRMQKEDSDSARSGPGRSRRRPKLRRRRISTCRSLCAGCWIGE